MSMPDLGCCLNIDVLKRFLSVDGQRILDVGCGAFGFTKLLAEAGARVLGIDPDPIQAEKNRAADPIPNIEFREAGADKLPVADRTLDGVTFGYSLHHVPSELYPRMYDEIFRSLQPGGFLYVIEPTDCDGNEVLRLFHDEQKVRADAWQSLFEFAVPRFESVDTVTYYSVTQFESWDDYANRYASKSFNSSYTEADVRRDEVRKAYERLAGPENQLVARKNVMALRGFNG
jgi:ubiquinone/menaquinone biosynthesis C-methylase UbiE